MWVKKLLQSEKCCERAFYRRGDDKSRWSGGGRGDDGGGGDDGGCGRSDSGSNYIHKCILIIRMLFILYRSC